MSLPEYYSLQLSYLQGAIHVEAHGLETHNVNVSNES
jgi:hypothetical protein